MDSVYKAWVWNGWSWPSHSAQELVLPMLESPDKPSPSIKPCPYKIFSSWVLLLLLAIWLPFPTHQNPSELFFCGGSPNLNKVPITFIGAFKSEKIWHSGLKPTFEVKERGIQDRREEVGISIFFSITGSGLLSRTEPVKVTYCCITNYTKT